MYPVEKQENRSVETVERFNHRCFKFQKSQSRPFVVKSGLRFVSESFLCGIGPLKISQRSSTEQFGIRATFNNELRRFNIVYCRVAWRDYPENLWFGKCGNTIACFHAGALFMHANSKHPEQSRDVGLRGGRGNFGLVATE